MIHGANHKTPRKLVELRTMLTGKATMLIGLQDNPDPDAFGAAGGLRKLANVLAAVQCSVASGGGVGRSENRAMARYLELHLRLLRELDLERFDLIALVDTQPGTGNNSLPAGVLPHIVIDHHPIRRPTRQVPFTDIRSHYGAASTMLFQYLQEAGIVPEPPLATALLYGIRSDTQDFGREACQADIEAFEALHPLANKRMMGTIQRGEVPSEYFRVLAKALEAAWLCGRCIGCELGEVDNPDMIPEVADLLLRHEDADWSLCWGYHDGKALLSLRTSLAYADAGAIMRRIILRHGSGGGHHAMAGGQMPLPARADAARRRLDHLIRQRLLRATGCESAACRKLV